MNVFLRPLLAVLLLAAFYVLAVGVLLLLLAADALAVAFIFQHPALAREAILLVVFSVVAGIAILRGMFVAARRSGGEPEGVPVSRTDEPVLWATVVELAGRVGTRPPDELRLVPEVNAAVGEDSRLLGLWVSTRRMYVGLPLLLTMTVDQARAVLAHELGHYSSRHTRLGAVVYRGAASLTGVIGELGPRSLLGRLFRGYAWLYFHVSQAVRRRQEMEADRVMVAIAGRRAAASSLRELVAGEAGWRFFLGRYVEPGWQIGFAPTDLFGGFQRLIGDPDRQRELDEIRQAPPPEERSPYDSHPSTADRLAAIETGPDSPVVPDSRPAVALLTRPGPAARAVQRAMLGEDNGGKPAVGWDEMATRAAEATTAAGARTLLQAAGRVSGGRPAELGTVLDLLQGGHREPLVEQLFEWDRNTGKSRESVSDWLRSLLIDLVACALLDRGSVRWRLSWSAAPYRLVTSDGTDLDVGQLVTAAIETPRGAAALRDWLHRAGVPMTFRTEEAPMERRGPVFLGAVVEAVRGLFHIHDMLVFDSGLLLVPVPVLRGGFDRLAAQVGSDRAQVDRVRRLLRTPYDQLTADPRSRFVPDSAIAGARLRRRFGYSWRLDLNLVDGGRLVLRRGQPPCPTHGAVRGVLAPLLGSRLR